MVRDGWRTPGELQGRDEPEEYEILLTTGGPALRIYGDLGGYNEPDTAELQWQDWGTPWTALDMTNIDSAILLIFARQFYFGE